MMMYGTLEGPPKDFKKIERPELDDDDDNGC